MSKEASYIFIQLDPKFKAKVIKLLGGYRVNESLRLLKLPLY